MSPEAEVPAPSTDPVAFTAHIRKVDEPTFELSPGPNAKVPAEAQVVSTTEQAAPEASAFKGVTQAVEPTGALVDAAPSATATPRPSIAHLSAPQPIEAPTTSAPAAPVKDLSLHIAGPQNVEVRVSEKSGEIRVDVRTADPALAQDIRGGLHELVSKLDAKGFTTEIATASEAQLSTAHTGDSGLLQDQSSGGPAGEQQNGAQQDEQQRRRQAQNQEAWSRQNQDSWFETISTNIEELSV